MAYGNWGGNVFRNGERMTNWEDQTPYKESEVAAGYAQAFLRSAEGFNPHHAVLGEKRVRLCGYKSYARLFVDGQEVDLAPYEKRTEDMKAWDRAPGYGEIDGYKFQWTTRSDPERVDLSLVEPDGTLWSGFSGFGMGAGYED